MSDRRETEEITAPLLDYSSIQTKEGIEDDEDQTLCLKVWIESKKLWKVVGPAIFSRIASYSMFVITQAFAGHLGELELAAMAIASNVVLGFDFGLLVHFKLFRLTV